MSVLNFDFGKVKKGNGLLMEVIFFSVEEFHQPPPLEDKEVGNMPDWAIAVVVIGLGSFAFVIIFGITVVSCCSSPSIQGDQSWAF